MQHAARFREVAAQLRREAAFLNSDRDRAATALRVLHRELLTGRFDSHCDSVAATLDEGRYNCVTATILFLALAEVIDLPTVAIHAPGHVRVRINGMEVEPTRASLDPLPEPLPQSRAISHAALLGKLSYNRGVAALASRDYAPAITALESACAADPGDIAARHNLLAAFNNAALACCEQKRFSAAAELLARAAALDPTYPPLVANDLHIHGQWLIALCEQRDFPAALALCERGRERQPHAPLFNEGRVAIYRLWGADLINRGEPHAARSVIAAGLAIAPNDAELLRLHESQAGAQFAKPAPFDENESSLTSHPPAARQHAFSPFSLDPRGVAARGPGGR